MPRLTRIDPDRPLATPSRAVVEATVSGLIVAAERLMEQKAMLQKELNEVEQQLEAVVNSRIYWSEFLDFMPRESAPASNPPRGRTLHDLKNSEET